ncbi:phospholipase C [Nannocystis pusilla]|uniref:Alkaline phosphatase family protein n=1 Tax=Nannocystis pusilla TaxID=889268 RepID=A0ABS7TZM8_9BACT|nr:alkaline phosphatase family protein [Nannocystis pusilla]MBZ5713552.1 alkaline phosphatase family protein [Nannocystis pusilla]
MARRASIGALLAMAGCAGAPGAGEATAGETEMNWDRPVTPPGDAEAKASRDRCAYEAGALPAETQGNAYPSGEQIPIDHIVVLMQENRSFDHYFQMLPQRGQPEADVAPADFTNPGPEGAPVAIYHQTQPCFGGTDHSWDATHEQIGGGEMDGFVTSNEGKGDDVIDETLRGERALGYYDDTDLPFYYWLANEFALADRYFSSVPGPTWPNRMYLYAGSSYGRTVNVNFKPEATIFDHLVTRGVTFKVYFSDTGGLGDFLTGLLPDPETQRRPIAQYFADAKAGQLPAVAFVNATFDAPEAMATWEHPPSVPQLGQRFVAEVVSALMTSPNWSSSALFFAYDEHGGLFDHVAPPRACPPDAHAPELQPHDRPGKFDQLGVRVPMMVISPFARKHYVSHEVYDHTSILRFIEARFVLPALTARDANALAPWDMFDFSSPSFATPPQISLPEVDPGAIARCAQLYPEKPGVRHEPAQ